MRNILALVFVLLSFSISYAQRASEVHIGVNQYEYKKISQMGINAGMSHSLNNIFSVGLDATLMTKSKDEYWIKGFDGNFEIYETNFSAFRIEALLDIFVLSLGQGKFETHLNIGAGYMNITNYDDFMTARAGIEQRANISKSLSLGLGYNYGMQLYDEEEIKELYIVLHRRF